MPSQFITTPVRFSYLFARSPKTTKKGESYGAMLIIPKSDKALIKQIKDALQTAFEEGRDTLKIKSSVEKLPSNITTTFYDGDIERPDDPACENAYYLNVSSNRKIDVVDKNRLPIDDPDEIYSGMYGRALIQFKAYNNESKGITCYLNGIQKTKEGPRLDGTVDVTKAFDDGFEDDSAEDDDFMD